MSPYFVACLITALATVVKSVPPGDPVLWLSFKLVHDSSLSLFISHLDVLFLFDITVHSSKLVLFIICPTSVCLSYIQHGPLLPTENLHCTLYLKFACVQVEMV